MLLVFANNLQTEVYLAKVKLYLSKFRDLSISSLNKNARYYFYLIKVILLNELGGALSS